MITSSEILILAATPDSALSAIRNLTNMVRVVRNLGSICQAGARKIISMDESELVRHVTTELANIPRINGVTNIILGLRGHIQTISKKINVTIPLLPPS